MNTMLKNINHPKVQANDFISGYITAALWSTNDNEESDTYLDENYSRADTEEESLKSIKLLCFNFIESNLEDLQEYCDKIEYDPSKGSAWVYAGHDLWLTQNRHGAGYWDRGLKSLGERLTINAQKFKEVTVFAQDGKVYFEGLES